MIGTRSAKPDLSLTSSEEHEAQTEKLLVFLAWVASVMENLSQERNHLHAEQLKPIL